MKNQPGTMKTHLEPWKTIKNHEKTWETMKTYLEPWKTNLEPWKTMKTNLEPRKTNLEPWRANLESQRNHENRLGTMKNQPGTMKNDENPPGTLNNQEKNNLELYRVVTGDFRRLQGGSGHFSLQNLPIMYKYVFLFCKWIFARCQKLRFKVWEGTRFNTLAFLQTEDV